jgi:hypothetical protein
MASTHNEKELKHFLYQIKLGDYDFEKVSLLVRQERFEENAMGKVFLFSTLLGYASWSRNYPILA